MTNDATKRGERSEGSEGPGISGGGPPLVLSHNRFARYA